METLTAKNFNLADVVKALAFNVPVVERTAPCKECYAETPVKNLNNYGLCPDCAESFRWCENCGEYLHEDEMHGTLCEGCYIERENACDPYANCMDIAHAAMEAAL